MKKYRAIPFRNNVNKYELESSEDGTNWKKTLIVMDNKEDSVKMVSYYNSKEELLNKKIIQEEEERVGRIIY